MKFNDYQLEAINWNSNAACIATAGSGKTSVLVERVYRLSKIVPPNRILCIAFNNTAVDNMKARLLNRDESLKSVAVSTIHSAALGCVRKSGLTPTVVTERYNKIDYKTGKIEKRGLVDIMMPIVLKYEMDSNSHKDDFPEAMLRYVGLRLCKRSKEINGFENYFEPYILDRIYKDFLNYMETNNLITYDMMCWKATNLLKTNDDLREYVQSKYDYIFIDECQDLSGDQYEFAKAMAAKSNIFMVGDGLQNIYGFKGGDSRYLLHSYRDFNGMKIVHLPINYRCSEAIVETSNRIASITEEAEDVNYMEAMADRKGGTKPKVLCGYSHIPKILKEQKEIVGDWGEIAILARTNAVLLELKSSLYKNKIPCYFNGKDGIPSEIKLMCEYLKLIVDTSDDKAFLSVINTPKRYVGKVVLNRIDEKARKRKISLFDAAMYGVFATDKCCGNVADFIEGVEHIREYKYKNAAAALRSLIKKFKISKAVKEQHKGNENAYLDAMDNIEAMIEEAKEYKDIKDFAKNYIEFINATDEGGVTLSTVHKAKGLEWKSVVVAGFNNGLFPHRRNDNVYEEIHILYVAATRAKDYLFFVQNDRDEESPFLEVMSDTVEIDI